MSRLARRHAALLRDLPLPVPFDVHALCEQVAARRGRPIRLLPMSGLTGVCGLWIATDHTDLIFHESETTPPHREHIILHELAHVLCDHHPAAGQALLPGLDPAMVRRVLGRAGYSSAEEREAELLASLIRQRATADHTLTGRLRTALDGNGCG
ncbi:hypothetical protein [Amycolatopsis albispora]|uniref:IrrE N-terminal-like domain-containing protein n=1 Tax=Amycolatopsis albispora TaxID=1804986 RepID=A0A344L488_9PSEU|nr:hypothetical protein [Amycolatopsis albispora]AXB42862.1 hypothetical protein A4R43_10200 [Amycolatopsis albispora]